MWYCSSHWLVNRPKKKAGFVERSDTIDGGVNGDQPGVIYVMVILSIQNGRRFTSMPITCFVYSYKNLSQPGNGKPKKDILSLEPSYIHRLIYPGIYPLFFAFLNSSLDLSWDLSPAFWIPNFIFGFILGFILYCLPS